MGFGLVLFVSGVYMLYAGKTAHDDVENTLADERIITSQKAEIPSARVTGPAEAKAQADVIRDDVLKTTGGKTYAEMAQNDPNRAVYLNSVTLRTALMQSYMAFKVADLVMGLGALVGVLGLAQAVLGLYLGFIVVKRSQPSVDASVLPEPPSGTPPPTSAWTGPGNAPQPR